MFILKHLKALQYVSIIVQGARMFLVKVTDFKNLLKMYKFNMVM